MKHAKDGDNVSILLAKPLWCNDCDGVRNHAIEFWGREDGEVELFCICYSCGDAELITLKEFQWEILRDTSWGDI